MKVLVVDDNIIDRKLIKHILQEHLNINAETAKDGLDALNKIHQSNYNLVITDIVMPKIEGIELINQIQTINPYTKIIAVSGNNPYYLYIVKKLGTDSIFTKPINVTKFINKVDSINKDFFSLTKSKNPAGVI